VAQHFSLGVMSISIPSESKKFRVAIIPLFMWLLLLGLPLVFCLLLILAGLDFGELAFASVFWVVYSFVASLMLSYLFPDAISPEGVYGHGFWGQRQFVRWQDVAAARTLRILNLGWLRVYSTTDSKTTWLGLFHSRSAEFREEIKRLAPPDSPILNCLR